MKQIRSILFAVTFTLGSAWPIDGQALDPASLEAELVRISDSQTLAAMAAARSAPELRTEWDAQIALGMILVRQWELAGDDSLLDDARRAFERARDALPDDPWAHWGIGLATARGPDVRSAGPELAVTGRSWLATFGLDDRSRAKGALEKALELDARFDRAAAVLAELAIMDRDRDEMQRAYDVLLRVLGSGRASDYSLTMLTRVADLLGDHETALRAGEVVADRADATPTQIHAYALALLRTEGRAEDGATAWRAAVERADVATMARIWAETSPIARQSEKERWATLEDLDARRAFLRDFWDVRAGMAAVTVGERLAEHYTRLAVALERYRRSTNGPMLPHAINQQWPEAPVDERGVMYIRHGEPLDVIRTAPLLSPGTAMCPGLTGPKVVLGSPDGQRWRAPAKWRTSATVDNESWVYRGPDGRYRLMNFLRCRGFTDYAIPYDVPCGGEWSEERKAYDMDLRYCDTDTRERVRTYTRDMFVTDTDAPDFDAGIPFSYDLLAFRGANGRTDLSAPVAILADSLIPDTLAAGRLAYSLDLSMFIVDTIQSSVATSDTTVRYSIDRQPRPGEAIVAYVNITVDATSDALQRIVVRETSRSTRGRMHGQHILIPSFADDSLKLSTIVLGIPGEGGNWRRGSTELTVMPIGEFEGGDFRAFYEIYNLAEDTPYETEIIVERVRDANGRLVSPGGRVDPVIQLRFQDVAAPDANGVIQELRSIDSDLEPGQYSIHVRVRNLASRESTATERLMTVR